MGLSVLRATEPHRGGFTLVELVLALGLLGIVLSSLIFLRLGAVQKVTKVTEERELRRVAQQILELKIAEFLSDDMDEVAGEVEGKEGWVWEWLDPLDPANIIQEGDQYLLACTVRLTYPNPEDPQGEPKAYELTTWLLPNDDQLAEIEEITAMWYGEEGQEYPLPFDSRERYGYPR